MLCRLQDRQLNMRPEAEVYEYLFMLWRYLLRQYPNTPQSELEEMAIDIAGDVSDLPPHRLQSLSRLAREVNLATRRKMLDNL
jgi:hypothetical protein